MRHRAAGVRRDIGGHTGAGRHAGHHRQKLNDAARNSLAKAETVERLKALGAIVVGDSPQEFRTYLEKDVERWERVIAASGLKVD